MKPTISAVLAAAVLTTALTLGAQADTSLPGFVDFGKFAAPADGGESVEVNLNGSLIAMAAKLTEKSEPEVADLLKGLRAVRVNVIGLNDQNRAELENRVKAVRSELDAKGWQRIVTVQNKGEDVGVYLKTRSDEAVEGLVVTVLDGNRQVVFVNIVGEIKMDKIAELADRLDIEPLKKAAKAIEKK